MNGILQRHRFIEPTYDPETFMRGDHQQVNFAIGTLLNWCREVDQLGAPRLNELGARLRKLRDLVAAHFAEEEEGGYLADVLDATPEFAGDVAVLEPQHAEFLRRFDELIQKLCCVEPGFECLSDAEREVQSLLADLRIHEHREVELLTGVRAANLGDSDE